MPENLRIYYPIHPKPDPNDHDPPRGFEQVIEEFKKDLSGSNLKDCVLTGLVFIPINRNVYRSTEDRNLYRHEGVVLRDIDGTIIKDNAGYKHKGVTATGTVYTDLTKIYCDTHRNGNFAIVKQYVNIKTGKFHLPETAIDNYLILHNSSSVTPRYAIINSDEGTNLEFWESDTAVNYVFFSLSSIIGLMDGDASHIDTEFDSGIDPNNKVILSGAKINYGESVFDTGEGEDIPTLKLERAGGLIKSAIGLPCPVGWKNSFKEELKEYQKLAKNSFGYLEFSNPVE